VRKINISIKFNSIQVKRNKKEEIQREKRISSFEIKREE